MADEGILLPLFYFNLLVEGLLYEALARFCRISICPGLSYRTPVCLPPFNFRHCWNFPRRIFHPHQRMASRGISNLLALCNQDSHIWNGFGSVPKVLPFLHYAIGLLHVLALVYFQMVPWFSSGSATTGWA
jgi:hypothetical protein